MGPSGHAVGLSAGERPCFDVMTRSRRRLERAHAVAPAAVILGLRHHPRLAQTVEKGVKRRARGQKARRQRGQIDQRGVEQLQPPVAVENRKADRQIRESLGQSMDEIAQAALGAHGRIGRKRHADDMIADNAPVAFVPKRLAPILDLGAARRIGGTGTHRQVDQPRQRPDGLAFGLPFGDLDIGRIGPGHHTVRILAPCQHG